MSTTIKVGNVLCNMSTGDRARFVKVEVVIDPILHKDRPAIHVELAAIGPDGRPGRTYYGDADVIARHVMSGRATIEEGR